MQQDQTNLQLFRDLFGDQLEKHITVVVGMDEEDYVGGHAVDHRQIRRRCANQFANRGLEIPPDQIFLIRPVAVGAEQSPPPASAAKLDVLKTHLAGRSSIYSLHASQQLRLLEKTRDLRQGRYSQQLLNVVEHRNNRLVKEFTHMVETTRTALVVKRDDGVSILYDCAKSRAWVRTTRKRCSVNFIGGTESAVSKMHDAYGGRTYGAVRTKVQLYRILKSMCHSENAGSGLVLKQFGSELNKERMKICDPNKQSKDFVFVESAAAVSDLLATKLRSVIDELLADTPQVPFD